MGSEAAERELEGALVEHITKFRLELGAGFAFVGRQVLLNVGGDDFFIDPKISKPTYRASNKLNAN